MSQFLTVQIVARSIPRGRGRALTSSDLDQADPALASKLDMHVLAEFSSHDLFEVESVEVKDGLIRPGRLPRSRVFVRKDPLGRNDLVLFIGEAQPPVGKYAFCRRLIEYARQLGVERVFTFAAMATQMHPVYSRTTKTAFSICSRSRSEPLADRNRALHL